MAGFVARSPVYVLYAGVAPLEMARNKNACTTMDETKQLPV